jgi:hypothetical protein
MKYARQLRDQVAAASGKPYSNAELKLRIRACITRPNDAALKEHRRYLGTIRDLIDMLIDYSEDYSRRRLHARDRLMSAVMDEAADDSPARLIHRKHFQLKQHERPIKDCHFCYELLPDVRHSRRHGQMSYAQWSRTGEIE